MGNQLFQYAYGKALSKKNNCELKLDVSTFEHYEWHEYSLKPLSIDVKLASKIEIEILKGQNLSLINRIKRKIFTKSAFIQEESLLFNPAYLEVKDPAYLAGYWQSEKYFLSAQDEVRRDFHIRIPPSLLNQGLLTKVKACNAVSLHIRRGNYVQIDFVNKVHGTCSIDYYERAVELISTKISNPIFFIFSDDIAWARENLNLRYEMNFVDINDAKTDYEDLRLMSSCKHHILANSTFSWWGAWLNESAEKIVIAPETWFADKGNNDQTTDLIPAGWIRI